MQSTYLVMPPETLLAGAQVRHRFDILSIYIDGFSKVGLVFKPVSKREASKRKKIVAGCETLR